MTTATQLAELSAWIDAAVPGSEAERLWGRTAKVAEENGEVVAAIIGYLGQNPRKGRTHTLADVVDELLDVAVAALAAVESIQGNDGRGLDQLAGKVDAVHSRMRAYLLASGELPCSCRRLPESVGCARPATGEDMLCDACRGCGTACTEWAYLAAEDLALHWGPGETFEGVRDALDGAGVAS